MHRAGRFAAARDRSCESVLALVLASSRGQALEGLTALQAKAAVPFGGQHRIVDFALSNCVNSGIRKIALLTQYKSQSLIRHVHSGWGFLHRELGEFVEIWPAQQQDGERWYRGTVDAVYQNTDLIEATGASYVLVLAGDQIYSLDYSLLLEAHEANAADLTVACTFVPRATALAEAIVPGEGRVERIEHPPNAGGGDNGSCLTPMGVYLFNASFLAECLAFSGQNSATADFARDVVPAVTRTARVFAHTCLGGERPYYWRTLNTVDRYWQAHMELLDDAVPSVNADPRWPVFTRYEPLPPARVLSEAYVDATVLSPGSIVAGDVTRSVISTRCRVGANAVIRDSVLLPGAVIGAGSVLDKVVVDCDSTIPADTMLGTRFASDPRYYSSPEGVILAATAPGAATIALARKIA